MIYNTGIKPQVQDEICHLAEKYHLNRVILFGSRARGDYWMSQRYCLQFPAATSRVFLWIWKKKPPRC